MAGQCTPTATSPHSSQLSLHPFLVLAPSIRVCIRLATILATVMGICLVLVRLGIILGICLCLSPVRRGRALRSGFRLGEYHTITITRIVNDRDEAKIPAGPTIAFGVVGELEGRRLRACALGNLGDMSQHEDNRARWTVCTASPLVTI
jgi:hypothetical protein